MTRVSKKTKALRAKAAKMRAGKTKKRAKSLDSTRPPANTSGLDETWDTFRVHGSDVEDPVTLSQCLAADTAADMLANIGGMKDIDQAILGVTAYFRRNPPRYSIIYTIRLASHPSVITYFNEYLSSPFISI
jgi:hypothetical protein